MPRPGFQMKLGTTGPDSSPIGCWLDMDHHDENGRRSCKAICTKCGHVVTKTGVSDKTIKRLFQQFPEECPLKEKHQYGRVPAPEQALVQAFQTWCMQNAIRYLKQSRGQYRIPLVPGAIALISLVNPEQCCWRLVFRGKPKYTRWGTIEELQAWLSEGKW